MSNNVPKITAGEVKKVIDNKEKFILLDVRTPAEYGRGKIEGSINIPVDDIKEKVLSVIPNKNEKIFVYCLSGSRSDIAVQAMLDQGFSNAFSMTNGLLMWRSKQYPLTP